jgi:hypothetical protein
MKGGVVMIFNSESRKGNVTFQPALTEPLKAFKESCPTRLKKTTPIILLSDEHEIQEYK